MSAISVADRGANANGGAAEDDDRFHSIKYIKFLGRDVPILCQNRNGPCPLLALCNVLLLRGHIKLPRGFDRLSIEQVIQLVANRILEANGDVEDVNLRANIDDVISILPTLQNGLDINVRFRHNKDYEFTQEIAVFDILGINLVHGWLYNSESDEENSAIGGKSYNELVEKIIQFDTAQSKYKRESEDEEPRKELGDFEENHRTHGTKSDGTVATKRLAEGETESSNVGNQRASITTTTLQEAATLEDDDDLLEALKLSRQESLVQKFNEAKAVTTLNGELVHLDTLAKQSFAIQRFFERTANQLSKDGLSRLFDSVKSRELCVFFRNNHFNTLFKYNGSIYLLLTDIGYLNEASIVWETLNDIDGNTTLVNATFGNISGITSTESIYGSAMQYGHSFGNDGPGMETTTHDGLTGQSAAITAKIVDRGPHYEDDDMLYAMKLQAEEDHQARQVQQRLREQQNHLTQNTVQVDGGGQRVDRDEFNSVQRAEYERLQKEHRKKKKAELKKDAKKAFKDNCLVQ